MFLEKWQRIKLMIIMGVAGITAIVCLSAAKCTGHYPAYRYHGIGEHG